MTFANEMALQYFKQTLNQKKYSQVLDGYLRQKRQLTDETIAEFSLGLAGDEWEGLIKYASTKDISPDELVRAGLAIHNEEKRTYYDRFRYRLMIPIYNLSGKPIAFGGRLLKKEESAKYINSPETPLYQKSNVLYGLSMTKDYVRNQNYAYIVEGYFDLISLWQAGIRNVVASSGTAFTLQQARLLARFAEKVYLFFDADSAGQKAALRSVDLLYDAGLEVKIIQSPPGEDPDTLASKQGNEKIEELTKDSLGFVQFRLKEVDVRKTGIIGKEKLIKEFGALGNKITDITRRTLFFNEAADALGVNVSIFQPLDAYQGKRRAAKRDFTVSQKEFSQVESGLLSLLFHNPGAMDEVFETISPEDFDSRQLARLYSAMIDQYRHFGKLDARSLIDSAGDPEFGALIAKVASIDWKPEQVETETISHIRHLTGKKRKLIRNRLKERLAEAEAQGDREKADNILSELKSHGL
jgi:DNA primase